jgi:Rrf2 family protein
MSRIKREVTMLSQAAEYALRAVVVLGAAQGDPLTTGQIAARAQIPAGYLAKILQVLGRAGLVAAHRGPGGGFRLARSPGELTVLDVIQAVDPWQRIERCPLKLAAHEHRLCPLHRRLDEGIARFEAYFGSLTLDQLVAEPDASRSLCEVSAHDGTHQGIAGCAPCTRP